MSQNVSPGDPAAHNQNNAASSTTLAPDIEGDPLAAYNALPHDMECCMHRECLTGAVSCTQLHAGPQADLRHLFIYKLTGGS